MPVVSGVLANRQARRAEDIELLFELPWIHELSNDEWRSWIEVARLPVDARVQQRLDGVACGMRIWVSARRNSARAWRSAISSGSRRIRREQRLIEIGCTDVRLGTYVLSMRAEARELPEMIALLDWLGRAVKLQRPDWHRSGPLPGRHLWGAN